MFKSTGDFEKDDFFDFLRFDDPSSGHQWSQDNGSDMTDDTDSLSNPYAQGDGENNDPLSTR